VFAILIVFSDCLKNIFVASCKLCNEALDDLSRTSTVAAFAPGTIENNQLPFIRPSVLVVPLDNV